MIVPRLLKNKDKIALCCPSYAIKQEQIAPIRQVIKTAQSQGINLIESNHLYQKKGAFAGSDKERLAHLQSLLDDPLIAAIWFVRGGYGLGRIIDQIDFSKFIHHPKWLIGYSDVTVLLSHVYKQYGIVSLHADMLSTVISNFDKGWSTIFNVLSKGKLSYQWACEPKNILGQNTGTLIGGNLSVLLSLLSTDSDYDYIDKILMIEDNQEMPHHIDRMLGTLQRNKRFSNLKGMIVGSFLETSHKHYQSFGQYPQDIILDYAKGLNIPLAFVPSIGHLPFQPPLFLGVQASFQVNKDKVVFIQNICR